MGSIQNDNSGKSLWALLIGLFVLGCGPEPERVEGLMPDGGHPVAQAEAKDANLVGGVGIAGAGPAVVRVVNEAEEEVSDEPLIQTRVQKVRIKMDSRARRAGKSVTYGVGYSTPFQPNGHKLDSETIHQGVLEPEATAELELEIDEAAVLVWVRTEQDGFAAIKSFRRLRDGATAELSLKASIGATARGQAITASGIPPLEGRARINLKKGKSLSGRIQGDGKFEVHFRGEGQATVSIDGLEQGGGVLKLADLSPTDPPQDLVVELSPGQRLGGILSDGSGRPVPGTQVLVLRPEDATRYIGRKTKLSSRYRGVDERGRKADTDHTDGTGSFLAEGLAPGEYMVLGRDDGNVNWRVLHEETLTAGREDYELTVHARRLRLRLAYPEGGFAEFNPLSRIRGERSGTSWKPLGDQLRVTLTATGADAGGKKFSERWHATEDPTVWEVSLAAGQRYRLEALSLTRPAASLELDFLDSELVREQVLTLSPVTESGKLRITVIDPVGTEKVTGYSITTKQENGPSLPYLDYLARPAGDVGGNPFEAQLELPAGRYEIRVRPKNKGRMSKAEQVLPSTASAWVDVVAGGSQVLTMETGPQGLVSVDVRVKPDPDVDFRDKQTGLVMGTIAAGSSSRWRASETYLPAGEYIVEAQVGGRLVTCSIEMLQSRRFNLVLQETPGSGGDGPKEYEFSVPGNASESTHLGTENLRSLGYFDDFGER